MMSRGCPYRLISLGQDFAFDSITDLFSAAAEQIAAVEPGVEAGDLFRRMAAPQEHHGSLRGKLLLMEIACAGLGGPCSFHLLGTASDVLWRGAPLRLFLFGLYRPEAIRSYLLRSARLYREKLTARTIRSWLDGHSWPEGPRRSS